MDLGGDHVSLILAISSMIICNRLVVAEYHAHTQLFLEALPVPRWRHHELVLDEKGRRFSKRDQGVTLRHLREAGWTPDDVRERVG